MLRIGPLFLRLLFGNPFRNIVGIAEKDFAPDTLGLVIVGCVVYRSSYDLPERQTRQTRY